MTEIHPPSLTIIAGPDDHGVVRHARTIAAAVGSPVIRLPTFADIDLASGHGDLCGDSAGQRVVQLHFTDRLFGDNVVDSVRRFRELLTSVADPVVVTLHDVPFPDATMHSDRRNNAYRQVLDLVDVAVVASRSERDRLLVLGMDVDVQVIPLPVVVSSRRRPMHHGRRPALRSGPPTIGVLGYVYPGKGHADVIEAAALLDHPVHLLALGRCSDGHTDMERELRSLADERSVSFDLTGFLGDDELSVSLTEVDVPVVPALRTSASASLHSWIAAGRRPLVVANDYTTEVATVMPGAMVLYRPEAPQTLADQMAEALARPDDTWRDPCHAGALTSLDAAADAHHRVYAALIGAGVR